MAKLGSYYGLCPLIDQHSLLGISEDEDVSHLIVTLGKNIAVKYKISDQKQVNSWRTKDKFTSPVIFSKEESKYVAVFNQVSLRIWNGSEEHLDKLKKYKFNNAIYTVLTCGGKSFVVFKNGAILSLRAALESRKDLNIDDVININTEEVIDVIHIDSDQAVYIGLLVKSISDMFLIWTSFVDGSSLQQFSKIYLNRKDLTLAGYVLYHMYDKYVHLFTLWSNGNLFSCPLTIQEAANTEFAEPFGTLYAIIDSISCIQHVTMATINKNYIALYGAESNQEGASLILYNVQFKVSQSKQSFKMFSNTTRIWCIDNNLLLCVGQNLAVVPFYLNAEQFAVLVGSHKVLPNEKDPDILIIQNLKVGEWGKAAKCNNYINSIPEKIKSDVLELLQQGLSEAVICEHLIFTHIEDKNTECMIHCLQYFEDIPEICIIKVIEYCITSDANIFKNVNAENGSTFPSLQPKQRCDIIDSVLSISYNDVLLLSHTRKLNIDETLLLLEYVCYLLSKDHYCLPKLDIAETKLRLIEWACMLLDANYQKILISNNEKIHDMLNSLREVVQDHLNYLSELNEITPVLVHFNNGKSFDQNRCSANSKYSIEEVSLYE